MGEASSQKVPAPKCKKENDKVESVQKKNTLKKSTISLLLILVDNVAELGCGPLCNPPAVKRARCSRARVAGRGLRCPPGEELLPPCWLVFLLQSLSRKRRSLGAVYSGDIQADAHLTKDPLAWEDAGMAGMCVLRPLPPVRIRMRTRPAPTVSPAPAHPPPQEPGKAALR